ncbi:MAG: radical SAM protein [Planctomycetes bacterium]|nr:radical SAM protein [Planctomycetota bacterium]
MQTSLDKIKFDSTRANITKLIRNAHFFKRINKHFFIINYSRQSFEISKELYELGVTGSSVSEDFLIDISREITLLERSKYLNLKLTGELKNTIYNDSLTVLSLGLVSSCNLVCSYCSVGPSGSYGSEKGIKMSPETARNSIDYLASNSGSSDLEIILFGGEPLLNWECILFILKYTKSKYPDKTWHFYLITNGTLIDQEKAKTIKEHDMTVHVTLTGPPDIHNKSRPAKGGRDSWSMVYDGIQTLKRYGVTTIIKSVVSTEDAHMHGQLKDYISQLEDQTTRSMAVFEHEYTTNEKSSSFKKEMQLLNNDDERLSHTGEKPQYFTRGDLKILLGEWGFKEGCDAGRGSLFVSSSGNLYSCHISAGANEQTYASGNINSGIDERKRLQIKASFEKEKPQCRTCWANSLCDKGCNYYKVSVDKFSDEYCNHLRFNQESAIYHSSFFDWAHIEKYMQPYTKSENLSRLKSSFLLREAIRNKLKYIKPIHIFPAVGNPSERPHSYLLSR